MNEFLDLNIPFSKLNESDLNYLLISLKSFYLQMRNTLKFNSNITFGLELEEKNISPDRIDKYFNSKNSDLFNYKTCRYSELSKKWKIIEEPALTNGAEIVSPILKDEEDTWKNLTFICNLLKDMKAIPNSNHMHIGAQIMKGDIRYWSYLLKFWTLNENIIYRFFYGENLTYRRRLLYYAKNIRDIIICNIRFIESSVSISSLIENSGINAWKSYGLDLTRINYLGIENMCIKGNTIEIRCPNGSILSEVWQNNINFIISFLLYLNSDNFDFDYIDSQFEKISSTDLKTYNKLDIKNALILADMIFNTNIDKLYFLKQYYKDGLESSKFKDKVKLVA